MKKYLFILMAFAFISCDFDPEGFFYTVDRANKRFEASIEWNNSHAPKIVNVNSDTYTLMFATDGHVGDTTNLMKLIAVTDSINAKALFFAGDLVTGRRADYEKCYNCLKNNYAGQYFPAVGNHELYFNGWKPYLEFFGSSVYYVELKGATVSDIVIVLDSGSGTLGNLQMQWLRDLIEKQRSNYRYCFIVHHVNIPRTKFSTVASPVVEEVHQMLDLFSTNFVNMVIMGHDHRRIIDDFAGTKYICIESFATFRKDPGCMRVDLSNDALTYDFIPLY